MFQRRSARPSSQSVVRNRLPRAESFGVSVRVWWIMLEMRSARRVKVETEASCEGGKGGGG